MKIIVIGSNGTIGNYVYQHLRTKHEVIGVSRTVGNVDISKPESVLEFFEKTGKVDAVVNCAGAVKWNDLYNMSEEDFYVGIKSKMMGQVNLVRIAKDFLNPNGSITLTTGILADDPVYKTSGAALVNGGINSFVVAAARELRNGIRINVVSPGLVEASADKIGELFPGHEPVSMVKVINGYVKSIQGNITGEVIRIY